MGQNTDNPLPNPRLPPKNNHRATRWLLTGLLIIFLVGSPTRSNAYDLVYDPINWAENLLQYIQVHAQTGIQSAISATETTISQITNVISQYTKYISQLENLVQQATGTVTGKIAYMEGLYSEIMSIPTSFENAFQSILNLPQTFENTFNGMTSGSMFTLAHSNDPIDRYLGSAVLSLQQLNSWISNSGRNNGMAYNAPSYSANLNQAMAAQVLKNAPDTTKTIATLQAQAKNAKDLQTGQAVQGAVSVQDVAARGQQNSLQAAGAIDQIQNQHALDQYKNTIIAGKEEEGAANLYGDFNP